MPSNQETVMSVANKKMSVGRLFWEQVALNFIVVAVLIALGALLTFKVMGEEYSEWTVVGFFATVFFAFIVFLPAGTLFAARAEVAKDKVEVRDEEKTGATAPIANPLLDTAPLGVAFAAIGTAIVYWLVYYMGWMPSPLVATLASLLFVVPYVVIVRLNIFRDIEGLAAQGAFRAQPVSSKTQHIWMTYIIPNVVFQAIINLPLGYRGFSHAAAAIADQAGPGLVPVVALAPDFAITFMFVCGFTFLAVMAHTASDMFEGEMSYAGKGRGNQRIPVLRPHPPDGRGARDSVRSDPARRGRCRRLLRNCNGPEVPRGVPVRLRRLSVGRRLDGQEVQ